MNHICSNTILIRSFNIAFLMRSLGTSFHSSMTKHVVVILVGRKLLQKFCSVVFIFPHCFAMLMSLVNLVIVVNN